MAKSIIGMDSLLKKLSKLGGNVEEEMMKSIKKQTKFVQGEAKELCPVDLGDLRNSITTSVKKSKGKITGIIATNSDHAAYVEFGTGKVGQNTPASDKYPGPLAYKQDKWLANIPDVGVRYVAGQPAQPYLYPALKNNEARVIENIKADIKQAIKEVARR